MPNVVVVIEHFSDDAQHNDNTFEQKKNIVATDCFCKKKKARRGVAHGHHTFVDI